MINAKKLFLVNNRLVIKEKSQKEGSVIADKPTSTEGIIKSFFTV